MRLLIGVSLALDSRLQKASHAFVLTVTQTPGGPGKNYTLSWTPAALSTTTAVTTYFIYEQFGDNDVAEVGGNLIGTVKTETTFIVNDDLVGTRGFRVHSVDSLDATFNDDSGSVIHRFIHTTQTNPSPIVLIADGDGTQRGVNQTWTFTYFMDDSAYVTMQIFPPGTGFAFNANGFPTGSLGGVLTVKTLIDKTPRSGELSDGLISNKDDTWDSRSSTGVIVGNGIYYMLITATLDTGGYYTILPAGETYLRSAEIINIPVDIIRILDLQATGITQTNAISKISYTLTGDSNVRVLISKPGSAFLVDSAGLIQAVNRATGLIDNTLVVSSFTFQRKAGDEVESWDGTSATGTVMGSGVYPVGVSATDDYGNHAIDNSGNDFPVFTTITLERSAGSQTGTTTNSDTTPPTIATLTPADGSSSNSSVTSVIAQFTDAATGGSAINLSGCSIVVRDPNSATVTGTSATSGTDSLIFTPALPMKTSGKYTITVTAADTAGNSATYTRSFTIDIRLDSSALDSTTSLFPNPAKNGSTTIRYALSVDASTNIDIFNILGERVFSATYNDANAPTIDHIWDLKNNSGKKVGSGLYLVRIKSTAPGSKAETTKKLVVIQ